MRIDVPTEIDGVDFAEAWTARLLTQFADQPISVLSKEHLIKNKRAAGRMQDLADVERLEPKSKKPRRNGKRRGNRCSTKARYFFIVSREKLFAKGHVRLVQSQAEHQSHPCLARR